MHPAFVRGGITRRVRRLFEVAGDDRLVCSTRREAALPWLTLQVSWGKDMGKRALGWSLERLRRRYGYRLPARRWAEPAGRLLPRTLESELAPGVRCVVDLGDLTQRITWWWGRRYEEPTLQVLARAAGFKIDHAFEIGDNWRSETGIPLPSRPSWIAKLDVEDWELRVLRGMSEALHAHAFACLAVELNPYTLAFSGTSVTEVQNELSKTGYERIGGLVNGHDVSSHPNGFFVLAGTKMAAGPN